MDVLSELERRHIAHLSIPRNIVDLDFRLRSDPNVPKRVETDADGKVVYEGGVPKELALEDYLNELEGKGLVVRLAEETDPTKMALAAQKNKSTIDLHDDSVEILSRRLTRGDLSWRAQGEKFMLSRVGLEAIKEPTSFAPDLGQEDLNRVINAEWQRVATDVEVVGSIHDHFGDNDPRNGGMIVGKDGKPLSTDHPEGEPPSLGTRLLLEEYTDWVNAVTSQYLESLPEELRSTAKKQLRIPVAGGASGWSDAYEILLVDAENQKTNLAASASPFFLALSLVAITDADTGTTLDDGTHKPTYTGYARASTAAADHAAASSPGGSAANTTAILWAACTAGSSTCVALAHCAVATVGVMRKWADISSITISTTQTPPTLSIGAYVTSAA